MSTAFRRWLDRVIWGRGTVECEDCGRSLSPHHAVWRGQHPYCSAEHESADLEKPNDRRGSAGDDGGLVVQHRGTHEHHYPNREQADAVDGENPTYYIPRRLVTHGRERTG